MNYQFFHPHWVQRYEFSNFHLFALLDLSVLPDCFTFSFTTVSWLTPLCKLFCSLEILTSVSLFQEQPVLRSLVDDGFIQESDMLYQAIFERRKGWRSIVVLSHFRSRSCFRVVRFFCRINPSVSKNVAVSLKGIIFVNPLSPNSDQHQTSPCSTCLFNPWFREN